MEDKKPCDDIFEGLAELLINNGHVTFNAYKRFRSYSPCGMCVVHTTEEWRIEYGEHAYLVEAIDGVITKIARCDNIDYEYEESEDK